MTTAGKQLSLNAQGGVGATGATGVGADGVWLPADSGLIAGNFDPGMMAQSITLSAGVLYLVRVKMAVASAISSVGLIFRSTASAGCANTFVGVYTQSGATATLLGSSSDLSSTVNGKVNPTLLSLSAATAVQSAGTQILAAFLFGSASTAPTTVGTSGYPNRFIASKQNYRYLLWGTGLTALPSTMDLSSGTASDGGFPPGFYLA